VSIDSHGQFCDEGAPEAHSISVEGCTYFFETTYRRVKSATKLAGVSGAASAGSASIASALDPTVLKRAEPIKADHGFVKLARFPRICMFRVLINCHDRDRNFCHAYVRICGEPPLLCIGTEFELCAADTADCFGRVVSCSLDHASSSAGAGAFVYNIHLEVFRRIVYLSCSLGTLSEVFHVFVENSDELFAEMACRTANTAAAASQQDAARANTQQRILDQKTRAKILASRRIHITVDQLGMVMLHKAFLVVQPLMSEILKMLMFQWYPGQDPCTILRIEDIFEVFLILRRNLDNLNTSFSFHNPDQDQNRQQLQFILDQIFVTRNWWAHCSVSVENCRAAMLALRQFITLTPDAFKPSVAAASVCEQLECIERHLLPSRATLHMTLDDVSYFFFGRASRHLSSMCLYFMEHLPESRFSVYLKRSMQSKDESTRQHGIVEASDIVRSLWKLHQYEPIIAINMRELRFDCEAIRSARNTFAHPVVSSGNRVILVLLALGSISRIMSLVSRTCVTHTTSPVTMQSVLKNASEHQTEIDTLQAELLERAGFVDVEALIDAVCEGPLISSPCSQYAPWATDIYRRLRLVIKGQVVGYQAQGNTHNAKELAQHLNKVQRTLLHVIARVPPCARDSPVSSADWLLSHVDAFPDLCDVQNIVFQDARVQSGLSHLCTRDDLDRARAAVVR
jgi:hypothetical protein